jgi:hypothetical protein
MALSCHPSGFMDPTPWTGIFLRTAYWENKMMRRFVLHLSKKGYSRWIGLVVIDRVWLWNNIGKSSFNIMLFEFITYPKKKMKFTNDYVFGLNTNKRLGTNTKVILYDIFLQILLCSLHTTSKVKIKWLRFVLHLSRKGYSRWIGLVVIDRVWLWNNIGKSSFNIMLFDPSWYPWSYCQNLEFIFEFISCRDVDSESNNRMIVVYSLKGLIKFLCISISL